MKRKTEELEYIVNNGEIITALVPYNDIAVYENKLESVMKRFIDVLGGICGILLLVPLSLIIFLANSILGDNGPLFYSQERIGKNGKKFKMYKFRSMVVDADERLQKYLE